MIELKRLRYGKVNKLLDVHEQGSHVWQLHLVREYIFCFLIRAFQRQAFIFILFFNFSFFWKKIVEI